MTAQQFRVVGGPNKFDLMEALFCGDMTTRHLVNFAVEGQKEPIAVLINSVEREDGSGESWNLQGYVSRHDKTFGGRVGKMHFSTQTRRGSMRINE
jgi:hypothetical protein